MEQVVQVIINERAIREYHPRVGIDVKRVDWRPDEAVTNPRVLPGVGVGSVYCQHGESRLS